MNNVRARKVQRIYEKLSTLAIKAEELRTQLEELIEEEQESYDKMSEAAQDGERGQKSQQAIDAMSSATDAINAFTDGSLDELSEVFGG